MVVIYYIYENYDFNLIHFDYWNILWEELIKLDNIVVFHKLAALRSLVVPHEQPNTATTEALVDALYNYHSYVSLCYIVFFTRHDAKSNQSLERKNSD
jgi:hypothetical protein